MDVNVSVANEGSTRCSTTPVGNAPPRGRMRHIFSVLSMLSIGGGSADAAGFSGQDQIQRADHGGIHGKIWGLSCTSLVTRAHWHGRNQPPAAQAATTPREARNCYHGRRVRGRV
eukprot:5190763-Amphidinium_carterae.1